MHTLASKLSCFALGLATLAIPGTSFAADTGYRKITTMRLYGAGDEIIYFDGSWSGGDCTEKNAVTLRDYGTTGAEMHKVFLAAFLAGKEVKVEFRDTECSGTGTNGREIVKNLNIR